MLQTEQNLSENDGILIVDPTHGISFQTAGAFQRLGRRLVGLFRTALDTQKVARVPMHSLTMDFERGDFDEAQVKAHPFSTLIFAPEGQLGLNLPVTLAALQPVVQLTEKMRKVYPLLHAIFVLPLSTSNEVLKLLHHPQTTIFLSPPTFGFRDAGYFDFTLDLLKKNPAVLRKKETSTRRIGELLYLADLAGYLVSTPQNKKVMGQIFRIRGEIISVQQWLEKFAEAFQPKASAWSQMKARFDTINWPEAGPLNPHTELVLSEVHEFFPTAHSSVERSLRSLAQIFKRDATNDLIFQPGRAL